MDQEDWQLKTNSPNFPIDDETFVIKAKGIAGYSDRHNNEPTYALHGRFFTLSELKKMFEGLLETHLDDLKKETLEASLNLLNKGENLSPQRLEIIEKALKSTGLIVEGKKEIKSLEYNPDHHSNITRYTPLIIRYGLDRKRGLGDNGAVKLEEMKEFLKKMTTNSGKVDLNPLRQEIYDALSPEERVHKGEYGLTITYLWGFLNTVLDNGLELVAETCANSGTHFKAVKKDMKV